MEAGCDPMALHGHAVRGLGLIGNAAASGVHRYRASTTLQSVRLPSDAPRPERSGAAPSIAWCRLGSNRPAVEVWARRGPSCADSALGWLLGLFLAIVAEHAFAAALERRTVNGTIKA